MHSVVEEDVVLGVDACEDEDDAAASASAASFAMIARLSTPGAKAWRLLQGSPTISVDLLFEAVSARSFPGNDV